MNWVSPFFLQMWPDERDRAPHGVIVKQSDISPGNPVGTQEARKHTGFGSSWTIWQWCITASVWCCREIEMCASRSCAGSSADELTVLGDLEDFIGSGKSERERNRVESDGWTPSRNLTSQSCNVSSIHSIVGPHSVAPITRSRCCLHIPAWPSTTSLTVWSEIAKIGFGRPRLGLTSSVSAVRNLSPDIRDPLLLAVIDGLWSDLFCAKPALLILA